ncbi:MAG: hypothetical protein ACRDPT_06640 [Streptomycetales bacterium]
MVADDAAEKVASLLRGPAEPPKTPPVEKRRDARHRMGDFLGD